MSLTARHFGGAQFFIKKCSHAFVFRASPKRISIIVFCFSVHKFTIIIILPVLNRSYKHFAQGSEQASVENLLILQASTNFVCEHPPKCNVTLFT